MYKSDGGDELLVFFARMGPISTMRVLDKRLYDISEQADRMMALINAPVPDRSPDWAGLLDDAVRATNSRVWQDYPDKSYVRDTLIPALKEAADALAGYPEKSRHTKQIALDLLSYGEENPAFMQVERLLSMTDSELDDALRGAA